MAWFESTRESDLRKSRARTLYDFEVECRWQGWGDPACVFDEEKDLFRLTDGRFASCLECPCACIGRRPTAAAELIRQQTIAEMIAPRSAEC